MTKLTTLALTLMLLIGLVGCAATGKQGVRIKCPACGYEFEPSNK